MRQRRLREPFAATDGDLHMPCYLDLLVPVSEKGPTARDAAVIFFGALHHAICTAVLVDCFFVLE